MPRASLNPQIVLGLRCDLQRLRLRSPVAVMSSLFSTIEVTRQVFFRSPLSFAIVNLKPIVPGRTPCFPVFHARQPRDNTLTMSRLISATFPAVVHGISAQMSWSSRRGQSDASPNCKPMSSHLLCLQCSASDVSLSMHMTLMLSL